MPALKLSERFVDQCSPVIDSNYATCGTITKASVDHLKKSDLDTLFTSAGLDAGGLYRDLDAWFFHSIEMKACGTRRFAWYDWIYANSDRSGFAAVFRDSVRPGVRAVRGPSLLHPWIMGRQQAIVNRDFWKLEEGIANSGYSGDQPGTALADMSQGPLTTAQKALGAAGDRVIRVTSRHGIPMDPAWFRAREVLHIFTLTSGVAEQGNWRVLASAVDTSLTYIDVLMKDENAGSTEPYDSTPGEGPQLGVIIPGINNVNDFESWCHNLPTVDDRNMVPFWYQTYRQSRCVDEEYLKVFKRLMQSNEAFKHFGDLEMAEVNKQDELEAQKRFVNAFFFQKPFNASQTLEDWESLDDIDTIADNTTGLTVGLGGKLQAKRANWVGVKEQMRQCNRVFDLANNPLNMVEFFNECYNIMRVRKSQGREVTRLDWHTNAYMREQIFLAMISYYKSVYDDQLRFVVETGAKNELGMIFDVYKVPFPAGLEIAIISDEFFDDWYTEHDANGIPSVGNLLLCLDIGKPGPNGGTIYYAQLAANRKMYKSARIEELAKIDATYRCVMEYTSEEQTLTSETGTVVVECPKASAWVQNIKMAKPVVSGKVQPYTDLY